MTIAQPTNVFWITGLSGAGKTTLCRKLIDHLKKTGRSVVMLDGDELREMMGATAAHTRAERVELASRYARLCHLISAQGISVAIATISLFKEVHEWNRSNLQGYVEIFVDVPLEELMRRDPKMIYRRAAQGELTCVAGVDLAVDFPQSPDIHLRWAPGLSADDAANQVISKLDKDFA
ncbi:MAG TPA: adenylyl-sulfate kinase [Rhodocyclaceae bacterium]|nr:adenylyl-sulfate kinase [Rhodocyclaceae bacterium]